MIIGRTLVDFEKKIYKNFLTKTSYYNISHLARDFLLKNKITQLPINLNDIFKQNKWKAVSYSKLKKLNIKTFEKYIHDNSGFTICYNNNMYVFYDDMLPIPIQRFTICHEIGHILLNHFDFPIANREQEANMFAARILMPMCVLYECNISNSREIEILCNVSSVAAKYRYERLEMLKKRHKFYIDKNEKKLKNQFKNFIKSYLKNK